MVARENMLERDVAMRCPAEQRIMDLEHQNQAAALIGGRDGYSRFGQDLPEHDAFSHGRCVKPLCRMCIHCDDHGWNIPESGLPDA